MKKLLSILILLGNGALLAMSGGGAGCPVGGDSCVGGGSVPDNVVHIEAELLAGGASYDKLISENLAAKRLLLNEKREASSKPKPSSGAGAEESKGALDPKVLKVYKNAGIDLDKAALIEGLVQHDVAKVRGVGASYMPEIASGYASKIRLDKIVDFNALTKYEDTGLTPEEAREVEELVQKVYRELSVIQKGLSKIEDVRQQQIDKYKDEKPLKLAAKAAAMADLDLSDLAVFGPQTKAEFDAADAAEEAAEIQAIFDGSVFADYVETTGGGFGASDFSNFQEFRREAFGLKGDLSKRDQGAAQRRLLKLYQDKISAYMNNIAVVDFLYVKFINVPANHARFGFFRSAERAAKYSDVVDTSLDVKLAKLREFFGVKDAS